MDRVHLPACSLLPQAHVPRSRAAASARLQRLPMVRWLGSRNAPAGPVGTPAALQGTPIRNAVSQCAAMGVANARSEVARAELGIVAPTLLSIWYVPYHVCHTPSGSPYVAYPSTGAFGAWAARAC